jgi:hypothetical protein
MLDEDDRVGARQVKAEPADVRRQEKAVDGRVGVECLTDGVALRDVGRAVEPHVRDGRHELAEEVVLDDVEHHLLLTEDEGAMLRNCLVRAAVRRARSTDAAVEQDLSVK